MQKMDASPKNAAKSLSSNLKPWKDGVVERGRNEQIGMNSLDDAEFVVSPFVVTRDWFQLQLVVGYKIAYEDFSIQSQVNLASLNLNLTLILTTRKIIETNFNYLL